MSCGAAVWVLTFVITPGEFVHDGPFTVEQCVSCGREWLQAFEALAKRTKRRGPRGFICMIADAGELERAKIEPRPLRCARTESPPTSKLEADQ